MKTRLIAILICLAMLLTLAGCSKTATETESAKDPVELSDLKLTLGTAPGPPTYLLGLYG